jgi:hypothetical protein
MSLIEYNNTHSQPEAFEEIETTAARHVSYHFLRYRAIPKLSQLAPFRLSKKRLAQAVGTAER